MATWEDIPLAYGSTTARVAFKSLLESSASATQRIALFGDSRSTAPTGQGNPFVQLLNYRTIQQFTGSVTGETPVCLFSSFGGGSPYAKWLMRGSTAGTNATADDTPINRDAILPGMGRAANATGQLTQLTSTNGTAHALRHDAQSIDPDAGIPTDVDYIGGDEALTYDFFGVQATGAPDLRWRYIPNELATSINYFETVQDTGTVAGLDGSSGVVKLSTSSVTNSNFATRPYSLMVCRIDGSETNAYGVGGRWRRTTDPGGITISTFSLGGYKSDDLVANHANAGQMLSAMGPWAASIIHLGVNDMYGASRSAATWKTNIQAMITQIRSASWLNDANHLILLTTDTPRINGTTAQDTQHDLLGGAAAEIADADDAVLVLNTRLACSQLGFTRATGATYLADDVHLNASVGSDIVARAMVNTMTEAAMLPDPTFELKSSESVVLSGSSVTSWGNASGGTSPTFSDDPADRILNYPVLQFDRSSSQYLEWDEIAATFTGTKPEFTVAMVMRPKTEAAAKVAFSIDGDTSARGQLIRVNATPAILTDMTDDAGTVNVAAASGGVTYGSEYLVIVKSDGTTLKVLVWDIDADSAAGSGTVTLTGGVQTILRGAIGCLADGVTPSNFYEGDISRIRIYNAGLTGDLTGDLTGTQLEQLREEMLQFADNDSLSRTFYGVGLGLGLGL